MQRLAWIGRRWQWFGVVIGVLGVVTYFFARGPLENLRRRYFDLIKLQRQPVVLDETGFLRGPDGLVLDSAGNAQLDSSRLPSPIAIVGYDDASLQRYEAAVIPREKIAAAITNLFAAGARVVAVDLSFEGRDPTTVELRNLIEEAASLPGSAKAIEMLRRRHDPDLALIESFSGQPIVAVFYSPFETDSITTGNFDDLPEEWRISDVKGCGGLRQPKELLLSFPELISATRWGGNAILETEMDGVLRRYPVVARIGDCDECIYPSLGFAAARAYRETTSTDGWGGSVSMECNQAGVKWLTLDTYFVPINERAEMELDFSWLFNDVFRNIVPLWQVAEGEFSPRNRFEGKLVFIGPISPFEDNVPTPASRYNGVGIHALAAHSIIHKDVPRRTYEVYFKRFMSFPRPVPLSFAEMVAVFIFCSAVTAYFLRYETSQAPLVIAIPLIIAGHFASKALLDAGIFVDAVTPTAFMALAIFTSAAVRYAVERQDRLDEERRRAATERELGRFLSPAVAEMALKQPELMLPARKEISILFSDIRGFTTTAEGMSPEGLVALLDEYLTAMTKLVFVYKGTLDKYIGDAVMALFGAPLDSPDHPDMACRTALAMIEELGVLQKDWAARKLPVLQIGIGINTGIVSVGRMGSRVKEEYTCIGDEVNFASRVEGLTKPYGVKILVGENTRMAVGDRFIFRDLGKVKVKGKTKAVRIYELLGTREQMPVDPEWIKVFEKGMEEFLARRWDEADELFKKAMSLRGGEDAPSSALMVWTGIYRKRPPEPDWDGTIERREK